MLKPFFAALLLCLCTQFAISQEFAWAKGFGGTNLESAQSVAVDEYGNIYVTGFFNATVDFDPGPETLNLTSVGSVDCFVMKLDPDGNLVWVRQIGGPEVEQGNDIAVDPRGHVVLTGYFSGTVDFDPGAGTNNLTASGAYDAFILKLDANGDLRWARQGGGGESDSAGGLSIDQAGNIYVCGQYRGIADFNAGAGNGQLSSAGESDIYVLKLNPAGGFTWVRSIGGTKVETVDDLVVDPNGWVYTMGVFRNIADFDPGPGTANLSTIGIYANLFVQKMDTAGTYVWAKQVGGTYFQYGNSIKVDALGDLYMSGTFSETADFDPGALTSNLTANGYDTFILKWTAAGSLVWVRQIVGSGNLTDVGESLVVDGSGDVYVAGTFSQTADFNPGPAVQNLSAAGGSDDAFILKLDVYGVLIWAKRFGSTGEDRALSIKTDPNGNIYTVGRFSGTADFDPFAGVSNLVSAGSQDIFVQKLSQNWNFKGTVYNDLNANEIQDADEPGLPAVIVGVPERGIYATTNPEGQYRIFSDIIGEHLKVEKSRPYWSVTPAFAVPDSAETPMHFAVTIPAVHDLCLVVTEITPFRTGFLTEIMIQVINTGTLPVDSALVKMLVVDQTMPDPLVFFSSEPAVLSQSANEFNWHVGALGVGETAVIRLLLRTPASTVIGTPVTLSTTVILADDVFPDNNSTRTVGRVVNAWDPNDKQVTPQALLPAELDTSDLRYLIRFQNTGNYPADFVVIRDTLPLGLDLSTLMVLGASHPHTWRLYGERILEVRFDPIILPDSTSDEAGSHGFVTFSVQPHSDLPPGDSIVNRAGIYFDYNAPVITNDAVLSVESLPVSVQQPGEPHWLDFGLSPNPVSKHASVALVLPEAMSAEARISVRELQGKVVRELVCPAGQRQMHLSELPAGVYVVQVSVGGFLGSRMLVVGI